MNLKYIFKLLDRVKLDSHDPRTQVGCVIFKDDFTIISIGSNVFARDLVITENRQLPENKKHYIVHAEIDAFVKAQTSIENASVAIPFMCCSNCARILIHAGVSQIYIDLQNHIQYIEKEHVHDETKRDFILSESLFNEAGVKLHYIKLEEMK